MLVGEVGTQVWNTAPAQKAAKVYGTQLPQEGCQGLWNTAPAKKAVRVLEHSSRKEGCQGLWNTPPAKKAVRVLKTQLPQRTLAGFFNVRCFHDPPTPKGAPSGESLESMKLIQAGLQLICYMMKME
jgi:hypothetical protein